MKGLQFGRRLQRSYPEGAKLCNCFVAGYHDSAIQEWLLAEKDLALKGVGIRYTVGASAESVADLFHSFIHSSLRLFILVILNIKL